jgi:hypothetical protein
MIFTYDYIFIDSIYCDYKAAAVTVGADFLGFFLLPPNSHRTHDRHVATQKMVPFYLTVLQNRWCHWVIHYSSGTGALVTWTNWVHFRGTQNDFSSGTVTYRSCFNSPFWARDSCSISGCSCFFLCTCPLPVWEYGTMLKNVSRHAHVGVPCIISPFHVQGCCWTKKNARMARFNQYGRRYDGLKKH